MVLILFAAVHLPPTIVAGTRDVPNKWSVVVTNVLLGWTPIGWVAALAMAARDTGQRAAGM